MATANKKFVQTEINELRDEIKRIQQAFMDDKISWEDHLLLQIQSYRDFVKQIKIHIK